MININTFDSIKPLGMVSELFNQSEYEYLALIQYQDVIDYYLLNDINTTTLHQLSYYLFISYCIDSFDSNNIKIIPLNDGLILPDDIHSIMSSYNVHLLNDDTSY